MLTQLHTEPRRLRNSHAYKPTRFEVHIGQHFCCAVRFVERNRDLVLRRVAMWRSERDAVPMTVAEAVQMIGSDLFWSGVWTFDEVLAYYWFKFVPKSHRRFVVDKGFFCEGIG